MSKRLWTVLSVTLTAGMLLAACGPAATQSAPTAEPTIIPATTAAPTAAPVQSTSVPAATSASVQPATAATPTDDSALKIGLVTDISGVNDKAFNGLAWEGMQKAAGESGFQAKFIESAQPADYEKNIDALATEGYDVIITVGSAMADATALKARQYPGIKFAIIDHAYTPDTGLTNVTSLMFAEEQAGFLAGVLAGGMSKSGFVCSITSIQPPASNGYVMSFRAGAVWQAGENIQGMNNYINIQTTNSNMPNVIDPTDGKETAQNLIGAGCDVVFGAAANGALLAAKENNVMAIGYDVDQYNTYPAAKDALMTSTLKNVDVAVYNYLKTVADGSVQAGISTGTLQNGGVGLAPFHDWDGKIPAELKARIQQAGEEIINGSIVLTQ